MQIAMSTRGRTLIMEVPGTTHLILMPQGLQHTSISIRDSAAIGTGFYERAKKKDNTRSLRDYACILI